MKRHPHAYLAPALACALAALALFTPRGQAAAEALPRQISDKAFWQMVVDFSEPSGLFRSDNFVSNEMTFQEVIPDLKKRSSPDGVYLGVGPDQNFTYITALSPRMAFIVDIRRQNLIQQLMYKAIVEMSADRADFFSRLFSRPKPGGLKRSAPPEVLLDAYQTSPASDALFEKNLQDIETRLITRHGFTLDAEDRASLKYVYRAFFSEGPNLRYSYPRRQPGSQWFATYADLMTVTDRAGINHGYVASEENYRRLREFERNNLLVPIVGDFAGGKALRAVGRYLADRGATVNYFYTSNVEQYLFQGDLWQRYYTNVGTLPINANSTFIRSYFDKGFRYPPGLVSADLHSVQLLDPISALLAAFRADQFHSYAELVERSR